MLLFLFCKRGPLQKWVNIAEGQAGDNVNLQQIYYFQTIYQLRNYTRASEQLHIMQSSLSHSISDLEKELGVPLFYKQGRNIVPSEYADRLLPHMENIIQELAEAQEEIREQLDPTSGFIRIGMSHTLGIEFMPNMIRNFCAQPGNENIRFELKEMTAKYVNDALCERKIDLGFGAKIENRLLEFYCIGSDEITLIVPKNHPFAERRTVTLEELDGEPLITFYYTCGTRYYIDELLHTHKVRPGSILEADTERMMAGLVAAGRGVAIIPVLPDLTMYDVVRINFEKDVPPRPMYMEWIQDSFMRPTVRKFRNFVMNEVKQSTCGT